jgi:hypothetical protein
LPAEPLSLSVVSLFVILVAEPLFLLADCNQSEIKPADAPYTAGSFSKGTAQRKNPSNWREERKCAIEGFFNKIIKTLFH